MSPLQRWLSGDLSKPVIHIDGATVTRGELLQASENAAQYLYHLGFRQGDVLAILVPDSPVWLQFLFAASRLGVLLVPISTRYRSAEIEHVLKQSRASGIVVVRHFLKSDFLSVIQEIVPGLPQLRHVIPVDDANYFVAQDHKLDVALPEPDPASLLCTFNTSGTTGKPKLAAHTQASIVKHAEAVTVEYQIATDTITLCPLPLYGVLGFVSAMATIAGGGRCVLQPVFKAEVSAQLIGAFKVTHIFGPDSLLDAVLRAPDADLRSLKRVGFPEFAGLGLKLARFAEETFGIRLNAVYGMSECFGLMAQRDIRGETERRVLPGGKPTTSDNMFRIADPLTGDVVGDGIPGELQLKGPNVMAGYLNDPSATAAVTTSDGWFRTGDLACSDGKEFTFLSRMKDSLRLRGYLVDPTEIETFLTTHDNVKGAQVVGVNRLGRGDVAVAFVIPHRAQESSEADLIGFCSEGIANYKVPSRIVFLEQFPEIAGPNGVKIQKTKLREMAETLVT